MDIGSLLLILGILILVGIFVARPFLEHSGTLVSREERKLSALLAERERLLNALEELDFDHSLGKIPAEDYPVQRTSLLQRGANVLRKLDEMRANTRNGDLEARLEAVINSPRAESAQAEGEAPPAAGRSVPAHSNPDDELEALIASRRRERNEKAAGFCPKCGGPVQKSDRFCPKCGATVD